MSKYIVIYTDNESYEEQILRADDKDEALEIAQELIDGCTYTNGHIEADSIEVFALGKEYNIKGGKIKLEAVDYSAEDDDD